jgi:hypothetical protein
LWPLTRPSVSLPARSPGCRSMETEVVKSSQIPTRQPRPMPEIRRCACRWVDRRCDRGGRGHDRWLELASGLLVVRKVRRKGKEWICSREDDGQLVDLSLKRSVARCLFRHDPIKKSPLFYSLSPSYVHYPAPQMPVHGFSNKLYRV